ncbi:MAG: right-handed parallel beta-helix repeat-containing protein, partial [Anaerolineae bacterium]
MKAYRVCGNAVYWIRMAGLLLLIFTIRFPLSSTLAYVNEQPLAVTRTVTSTADSGSGTLRDAIQNASADDVIVFSTSVFPPSNPQTISLVSPLSWIEVTGLQIDASNAGVIVSGAGLTGQYDNCFMVRANNVTIRGLQIVNCPNHGVEINNGASFVTIGGDRNIGNGPLGQGNRFAGNRVGLWVYGRDIPSQGIVVKGNLFGTTLSGTGAAGNSHAGATILKSDDNVIGGSLDGERNVFSANGYYGLELWDCVGVTIENNYAGTNLAGTAALGNSDSGILVVNSANVTLKNNLISGNQANGIFLDHVEHTVATGNMIGTDKTGTLALGNGGHGLGIRGTNFTIGGANAGEGNLISGNGGWAALLLWATSPTNAIIQGNIIGTNQSGTTALRNMGMGIHISGTNTLIGGALTTAGNLVSGNNGHGIWVESSPSHPYTATIMNNIVGVNINGTAAITNAHNGITLDQFSDAIVQDNLIGGNGGWAGLALLANTVVRSHAVIQRNVVGTDRTGNHGIANWGTGIYVTGTNEVLLGGYDPAEGNLVSGNGNHGIYIESSIAKPYTAAVVN